jgi:hypothetical protein
MIQNAMQEALKMHNLIEATLRRVAPEPQWPTMAELRAMPEIKALEKNQYQVRDIVDRLYKQGYVSSVGERLARRFAWNLEAQPYVFTPAQRTALKTQPSPTTDPRKDKVLVQKEAPDVQQEVELVVAGVTIVVSKNPVTGRPRITIEG